MDMRIHRNSNRAFRHFAGSYDGRCLLMFNALILCLSSFPDAEGTWVFTMICDFYLSWFLLVLLLKSDLANFASRFWGLPTDLIF